MTTQFFYLGLWADNRLFSAKRSFIGGDYNLVLDV